MRAVAESTAGGVATALLLALGSLAAQVRPADPVSARSISETGSTGVPVASTNRRATDVLVAIDGAVRRGRLIAIASDGSVRWRGDDDAVTTLALDAVRRITFGGPRSADEAGPGRTTLWLRSGLALPAVFRQGSGSSGRFQVGFTDEPVEFEWRHIRAVGFGAETSTVFQETLRDSPSSGSQSSGSPSSGRGAKDYVFAAIGAGPDAKLRRVSLRVTGIDADGVHTRESSRAIPLARVRGIIFAEERGVTPDPLPAPTVSAHLAPRAGAGDAADSAGDGLVVGGQVVAWTPQALRLRLAEGSEVAIPAARVAALEVRSDKLVALHELERQVEQTAAFDRVWPIADDRMPNGQPIRIGGVAYERGIVVVPHARFSYRIEKRFDRFEATIGHADGCGPLAHAVVRVWADDRVVFDSGPLVGRAQPRSISADLGEAEWLRIEVDFGDHFDLGDRVAIVEPRLLSR